MIKLKILWLLDLQFNFLKDSDSLAPKFSYDLAWLAIGFYYYYIF